MKKVIVASQNPIKLRAASEGFRRMFPDETFVVSGLSLTLGISHQPANDSETYEGAYTRADAAHQAQPDADFWVGIEGGIEAKGAEMESFAWVVVLAQGGRQGKGRSCTFFLAPRIAELITQGKELGEADDIVFGQTNSKQAGGAVGLLTRNVLDRTAYYTDTVIFALIPFKNEQLYFAKKVTIQ